MTDHEFAMLKKVHSTLNSNGNGVMVKNRDPKQLLKGAKFKTAKEAERALREREQKEVAQATEQLDLFPDFSKQVAAMPNTIARSALFAPIARGRRKYHDEVMIASRSDVSIGYSGKQLDMGDSDVFMHAIKLAADHDLGEEFQILPYGFLLALGRGGKRKPGATNKKWLRASFKRLKKGVLTIETGSQEKELSLIDEYTYNKKDGTHYLKISPKILFLFRKQQYGLIDWDKRKAIKKRINLAKWLQTYIASNTKGEQRIGVEKLKRWCGQKDRRTDHFTTALKEALKELERVEIISSGKISKTGILTYTRL
ncbi:MAG: hypothetical protein GY710_15680 [Desulfobacteraceae bacterium]|nr:hypothetical protein [Desulfobacteraceae bacterium]